MSTVLDTVSILLNLYCCNADKGTWYSLCRIYGTVQWHTHGMYNPVDTTMHLVSPPCSSECNLPITLLIPKLLFSISAAELAEKIFKYGSAFDECYVPPPSEEAGHLPVVLRCFTGQMFENISSLEILCS